MLKLCEQMEQRICKHEKPKTMNKNEHDCTNVLRKMPRNRPNSFDRICNDKTKAKPKNFSQNDKTEQHLSEIKHRQFPVSWGFVELWRLSGCMLCCRRVRVCLPPSQNEMWHSQTMLFPKWPNEKKQQLVNHVKKSRCIPMISQPEHR